MSSIVIPMMGLSRRFFDAGYSLPKYQLQISGTSVFERVLLGFEKYFAQDQFIFVCMSDESVIKFIEDAVKKHNIQNYVIYDLNSPTLGQADTVYQSRAALDSNSDLFIYNIDTIHVSFTKSKFGDNSLGYLEVFEGDGDHWSFVRPKDSFTVIETAEKKRISSLCSNGLYQFSCPEVYTSAFEQEIARGVPTVGEYYIAPLYNNVIKDGGIVNYKLIRKDDNIFCGTPTEYENCLRMNWT